jgi:hypothetical protein
MYLQSKVFREVPTKNQIGFCLNLWLTRPPASLFLILPLIRKIKFILNYRYLFLIEGVSYCNIHILSAEGILLRVCTIRRDECATCARRCTRQTDVVPSSIIICLWTMWPVIFLLENTIQPNLVKHAYQLSAERVNDLWTQLSRCINQIVWTSHCLTFLHLKTHRRDAAGFGTVCSRYPRLFAYLLF